MIDLMAHKVNLDALIQRADFEITSDEEGYPAVFTLPELESTKNTYKILRKPEFQRYTSDWTPQQVVALVKNFIDRDLIPAIIIWNSPARLQFVMDGAHRLSALIAWVNDDYGFGTISQQAQGRDAITKAQKDAHNATKALMADQIGSYSELLKIGSTEGSGTPDQRKRAMGMNSFPIEIQQYNKPDRRKAEGSFYRINQGGTALNKDEREIIRTRQWPESIAARAVWRTGKGRQYWSSFKPDMVKKIEGTASEIQSLLLKPEIDASISPLQVPVIADAYTNAGLGILDQFVHLANDLPDRDSAPNNFEPLPEIDPKADQTGDKTLEYLSKARKLAEEIASKKPYSLGLHPGVYAYSKSGKFLPGAFFAEVLFLKDLIKRNQVFQFADNRKVFEEFLVTHKHYVTLLTHDGGAKMKSAPSIFRYYKTVLGLISRGKDVNKALAADKEYKDLVSAVEPPPSKRSAKVGNASIPMMLRESLNSAVVCEECGARIYKDAWTHGHRKAASEGGTGHSNNLGSLHPTCNSGHVEKRRSIAKKQPKA
jgi:hypothetical protein